MRADAEKMEAKGWGKGAEEHQWDSKKPKGAIKVVAGTSEDVEILISEADEKRISRRRQEEEKKVEELEANYDEYNQYMNMIGKMLGVDEGAMANPSPGPRGSNMALEEEP